MSKLIKYQHEARQKMFEGIKKLTEATKITLGPKGKNVIIEQPFGYPHIINDGALIAQSITLVDQFENLGAQMLVEAATKTNELVGDGTTTSIVLASSLIELGLKAIEENVNSGLLRQGFDHFLPQIIEEIRKVSTDINDISELAEVAVLSSNDETIGQLIEKAYQQITEDGIITLEESKGNHPTLEVVKGYVYEKGYVSSYMTTSVEKQVAILEDALVLVTNRKINSLQEVIPFLEVAIEKMVPILIICDDIDQDALGNIVLNKLRGAFNCVITKSPFFGQRRQQVLKDIAYITRSVLIDSEAGMTFNVEPLTVLGEIKKAIITKDCTTLIDNRQNIQNDDPYIITLKHQLSVETSSYEKEWITKRLARLLGGIALIKVGANSESQLRELYLRYEDALNACKAAKKEGIVEGGGKVLWEISERLVCDDMRYQKAFTILQTALKQPFIQMLENADLDYREILQQLDETTRPREHWFDIKNNQIVKLKKQGIMDPTSVVVTCITTSVTIASLFLSSACAIIDTQTEKEKNINDSF